MRGDVVSSILLLSKNLQALHRSRAKIPDGRSIVVWISNGARRVWSALQKLGLEEIPGVGALFNPNIHEVLTTMPVADAVMNDTVIQVYENGYRINNTVVKTSKVIVGKYYAPPASRR